MPRTSRLVGVTIPTVISYFNYFRDIWLHDLEDHHSLIFGEYEVDECQVKHIFAEDGNVIPIQWISGIFERATGKLKLYTVANRRTIKELIPPIEQDIPFGSLLYSDDWTS